VKMGVGSSVPVPRSRWRLDADALLF